jgi:hypothetical protein
VSHCAFTVRSLDADASGNASRKLTRDEILGQVGVHTFLLMRLPRHVLTCSDIL